MDEKHTLTRALGFGLLICCSALAFCISLLALTWFTGKLPFGVQPLIEKVEAQREPPVDSEEQQQRERLARQRYGELYATKLYQALAAERQALAAQREEIDERRLALAEYEKVVRGLQADLEQTESRVRSLLRHVDETERGNVDRLSQMVSESDPPAGARILLSLPSETAARVLRGLEPREAAPFVDALLVQAAPGNDSKAGEILSSFQVLAGKPAPSPEEAVQ